MGSDAVSSAESTVPERSNLIELLLEGADMGCSHSSFDGSEGRVGKYLALRTPRFMSSSWEFDDITVTG